MRYPTRRDTASYLCFQTIGLCSQSYECDRKFGSGCMINLGTEEHGLNRSFRPRVSRAVTVKSVRISGLHRRLLNV